MIAATDTLAAIQPILPDYDIYGFAEHSLVGVESIRSIEVFRGEPRSGYLNLGKGFGFEAALVSGYMEAIEVCTVETVPQVAVTTLSHLDPNALIYTAVKKQAVLASSLPDDAANSAMICGVDLLTAAPVYGFVSENFLPDEDVGDVLHVSTNGLASGNSLVEARLHALYELIERHVTALSLQSMGQVLLMDLRDIPSPLCEAIAELNASGWRCEFFLLGRMLGVVVIQCALSPIEACATERLEVSFGWGAHHELLIAMARAIAEAVQGNATRSACQQDSIPPERMRGGMLLSGEQLAMLKTGASAGERILLQRLRASTRFIVSLEAASDDILVAPSTALAQLVTSAREAGISHLFSWTLSPPERPFSVVKCVVPEFKTLFS